jgi:hypothetical protein
MFRSYMVRVLIGFAALASASSTAQAIISSVSWKPGVADPNSVFTINPANPTTNDMIFFFDPRNHQTYGNLCVAETTTGRPGIFVDPVQHLINVTFVPQIGGCTAEFDPVSGLQGAFGELPAGQWTFTSQPGNNHTFTVSAVPEPGTFTLLGLVVLAGMRRRTISFRQA